MIHLRQIALVARNLANAQADLEAVLGIKPCHIDPEVAEFGLENVLLPVGANFIEVVAPTQDGTAAGRFMDRRGGDGGYMVIAQVETREEQAEVQARAADNNVRVAWEADRPGWRIMQLHPRDMGASFFEVDWHENFDPKGHWGPAGGTGWEDKIDTSVTAEIIGAELQADNPAEMAAHWAAVAGVDTGPDLTVPLANATLRFVPDQDGRGPGLSAVDIRATDKPRLMDAAKARGLISGPDTVTLCGTRFHIAA